MSAKREIPPRPGIEVFLNQGDTISIKQVDLLGDETTVVVHPDDVPQLVRFLVEVQAEAYEAEAYEDDDETKNDTTPTNTGLRLVNTQAEPSPSD